MKLAVLDRDGVINEDSDHYIKNVDEFIPIAGSIEAIARLSQQGYTVAVATNQSGLSRGLFDLDDLEAMHEKLCRLVEEQGGVISGIFYCPHHPDDQCHCRKPQAGLLDAIAEELQCELKDQIFIGDSLKDLQAARLRGCQPILVKTGKGADTFKQINNNDDWRDLPVFDDLSAAVDHLLEHQV